MGLFNVLRDWRSKKSKQQGVPPYLLFTNRQFAEIVKQRPQNLSDLGKIDGIGKAKLDRYGADILAITKIEPETGK
jgi:superfamily II DNA helicase RecQ